MPNAEVECEEVLPHEQNVHQDHGKDALRVPDAPARIDARLNLAFHSVYEA